MHKLSEYIKLLDDNGLLTAANSCLKSGENSLAPEKQVAYISFDSNDVKKDTLFVCKGAHFKEEYLKDAAKKGAFCYVSERDFKLPDVLCIQVCDIRQAMPLIASLYYDNVWQKLTLIGITGTKGKSTTTYFMRSILDEYLLSQKKRASAVISGIEICDGVTDEESQLTTPESFDIYRHFDNAVKSGIEYLTMEVSSQALKYGRTAGITFDVGCFLNIGEDHISDVEHPTLEDYVESKLKLMTQCKTACINAACEYARRAADTAKKHASRIITFNAGISKGGENGGINSADINVSDIKTRKDGASFRAFGQDFDERFEINIPGVFNIENALAAIAVSRALGIPAEYIKKGLLKTKVKGRMEIFHGKKKDITVIVDYAHNMMSFEALFDFTKKEYPKSKVGIVFGCPGGKATCRRKELGETAGKHADKIYITEDDPGIEDMMAISRDIEGYVRKYTDNCEIIRDREEAVLKAINEAPEGAVLLIAGKGRETHQKRGLKSIKTPSDVDYVQKYLG